MTGFGMTRIAILALQGAFAEHEHALRALGADTFEIRQRRDWDRAKDGLVIPGGESTVQLKLLHELGLFDAVRADIAAGLPVFGTCAGLILLARDVEHAQSPYERLATIDMAACRNAYGRQLGSFHATAAMRGIDHDVPMTFIRAPYISRVWGQAEALATVDGHIVAARQGRQLVTAFHPELDSDPAVHQLFLNIINKE